jgi:hypothetical protein
MNGTLLADSVTQVEVGSRPGNQGTTDQFLAAVATMQD